jgi:hypothetical protein
MPLPVALPLTYPDTLWTDDMDANGQETTSDLQTLAQDVYHVLEEAPSSNWDDGERGLGLAGLLSNSTLTLLQRGALCDVELKKDPRIQSSLTTITLDTGSTPQDPAYQIAIEIQPVGSVVPLPLGFSYAQSTGLVPSQP